MAVPTIARTMAVAEGLLAGRYAGADAAFVSGSILRGQATAGSDLDLVVLFPVLETAWRESFLVDGLPVEAFVHDAGTLRFYLTKDAEGGRPVMPSLLADATIIGPRRAAAARLAAEAAALLAKGPPPLAADALDLLRYRITDLLADLRDPRPAAEMRAIAAALMPDAAQLILRGRGYWMAAGKWIPRSLRAADAALAARFDRAFAALLGEGRAEDAIALIEAELARHGGPLFDGFRLDAPAGNRLPVSDADGPTRPPTSTGL